jgi:hypothetical protein
MPDCNDPDFTSALIDFIVGFPGPEVRLGKPGEHVEPLPPLPEAPDA